MNDAIRHLDRRFAALRPLVKVSPPSRGWLRAIRDALGMTTKQMASRLGVSQPRIVELEQSEMHGNVTLNTLRRAAEALDCRVVYAIVPNRRLKDVVSERAEALASRMTAAVEQSMRLEAQEVGGKAIAKDHRRRAMERLMLRPARLWDEA